MSKPKSKAALRQKTLDAAIDEVLSLSAWVHNVPAVESVTRDLHGVHRAYDKDGKLCAIFGDHFAEAASQMRPRRKVKRR